MSGSSKTIFITGAASGIGAETARYFASKGWFVGLYDIDEPGLGRIQQEIGADKSHAMRLDVTKREDWQAAISAFADATDGQMHVLFNNAGIGNHGWFEDITPEDAEHMININVTGVVNGVYAAQPLLKATPNARIINNASVAGIIGTPRLAVYSATKFAVRGLTEALDAELASLGISVCCVMSWFVDTPILSMSDHEGSNRNMKDDIQASGLAVYPVSLAAETVWEAAHGSDLRYFVGREARKSWFGARFFPKGIRKRLRSSVPPRD